MDELFGLSMNVLMIVLLTIFLVAMAIIVAMALRNRIMVKLGLRNIPRRKAQTILIIIGVMLSTVIMSAAFGTGDTISHSIRHEAITALATIDEFIISRRADAEHSFGRAPDIPFQRFEQLKGQVASLDIIDGLAPVIGANIPALNTRTSLNEPRLRVVGVDPAHLEGFDTFTFVSGGEAQLADLLENEVYITDEAADELDAREGDELRVFVASGLLSLKVKGVINRNGLAGVDPTMLIRLSQAQSMFDMAGRINLIVVSNRGDEVAGAKLSEEVTRELRVLFADREMAVRLKELLNQEAVLEALNEREDDLDGQLKEDSARLREEVRGEELSDELISLLGDEDIEDLVLGVLQRDQLREVEREAVTLFEDLAEIRVADVKRDLLDAADLVGSFVTTFFVVFSLFSIAVGILLIFLIFVMLAAERMSEMGMARAVGAKRSHLVQMFVFEGTAYALVSAAVGVLLGLAVSVLMIAVLNWIFGHFDNAIKMTPYFEPRSAIIAYCLGMVITFATVAVSAYRVSRLNIVSAVRGLPEANTIQSEAPFLQRALLIGRALVRPLTFLWRTLVSLPRLRYVGILVNLGLGVLWVIIPIIWIVDVTVAIFRFVWPYLLRGWLTFLLGLFLAYLGVSVWEKDWAFSAGASLMVIGLGLMLRSALKRTSLRAEVRDRISFTFTGVVMLVFWVLPVSVMKKITGELESDFEMMFVSGIFMVAAAVWTVMYNTDLLLRALTFLTGRFGKLRPVLVTAVAYPMSAKYRTGLTLAMFALVVFTLMVMSILGEAFSGTIDDAETVTGGWDIEGEVSHETPIEDIRGSIAEHPDLRIEDYESIGSYTWLGIRARQVGAKDQDWHWTGLRAAEDDFLAASNYELKLIAEGFGTDREDVWRALRDDPNLAVVGGAVVATREGDELEDSEPWIEGLYYKDTKAWAPIDIEVREPRTGTTVQLKVVGVLDRVHEASGSVITSKDVLDDAIPFPIPITNYRFRVAGGVDPKQASKSLEAAFVEHGMEAEDLEGLLGDQAAVERGFWRLFTGFMALGLLVGVAALGVISTRAVVERRQQIGVLRAIGYRRRMVQLSFLLESSFVSLLGIAIGAVLGIVLAYQAVSDIREEEGIDTIRFTIPWIQIVGMIGVAYLFSLVTTFLPARQASRTYPAEALRYE